MNRKKKSKIKFFTLYETFTESEKNQFRMFVSSPLFNSGRDYTKLLDKIDSSAFNNMPPELTKKERTSWNRLSELTKLAERFIVIRSAETRDYAYDLLLLNELKKRKLNDYFSHNFEKLKLESRGSFPLLQRSEYLEINQLLEDHFWTVSDFKKLEPQVKKTSNYRIGLFLIDYLDDLIHIWKLKKDRFITGDLFAEKFFQSIDFRDMLTFLDENVPALYPVVAFYVCIYNSLKDPRNRVHYENARSIFETSMGSVDRDFKEKLYGYLIDAGISALNANQNKENAKELFRIMNKKLKEGLNKDIQTQTYIKDHFRNYIIVAIFLKKLDWADKFIMKYGKYLPDEIRDDVIRMSEASLLFERKEYLMCKELLNKVRKTDAYHYSDAAILKLILHYELGEYDEGFEELRRLRDYFHREHMIEEGFVRYRLQFCELYFLLIKCRQSRDKKTLFELTRALEDTNVPGKGWIKAKLAQLGINLSKNVFAKNTKDGPE